MNKQALVLLLLALFAFSFSAAIERREDELVDVVYRDENENENEIHHISKHEEKAKTEAKEKAQESVSESAEFESEAGAEEQINAQAQLAISADVEAETEAEVEVGITLAASVSAMTSAEIQEMSSAADKLDEAMEWVYARVRRAAQKCPRRSAFKGLRRHHHHRVHVHVRHHHHAPKYVVPEFYEATCADVHRHLNYAQYIAGWMKASVYRMTSPALVDPLYHSTFGKCHHFDSRKLRKRCRRIRMLRKALHSPLVEKSRRFVTPLKDISALGSGVDPEESQFTAVPARKGHGGQRRRRLRHLRRSIHKLARGSLHMSKALASLSADIARLRANLNGVKMAGAAGTQTPQAQSAANLEHMNKVLTKIRSCLPKVMRRLGKMQFDVEKVSKSLGGRRHRRHHRARSSDYDF